MRSKVFSILAVAGSLCLLLVALAKAQRGQNGQEVRLPEGAGQQLVQSLCAQCHGLNQIVRSSGYDLPGWRALIGTMIALPDAQAATITKYLAEHFPEKPGRRPTLIQGDVSIEITEWMAPTLGQRSRDPIQAPDGSIWWAGSVGQPRWTARSRDGQDGGIPPATRGAAAQLGPRRGRKHLVHGKQQWHARKTGSQDRYHHRIQNRRPGPSHGDLPPERRSLLHRSAGRYAGTSGP